MHADDRLFLSPKYFMSRLPHLSWSNYTEGEGCVVWYTLRGLPVLSLFCSWHVRSLSILHGPLIVWCLGFYRCRTRCPPLEGRGKDVYSMWNLSMWNNRWAIPVFNYFYTSSVFMDRGEVFSVWWSTELMLVQFRCKGQKRHNWFKGGATFRREVAISAFESP